MTGHLLPKGKPHEIGMPSLEELEILARPNRRRRKSKEEEHDTEDAALEVLE